MVHPPLSSLFATTSDMTKKTTKTPSRKTRAKKRVRLTAPTSKKEGKPFLFLSLPPELRDYIYELALTDSEGLAVVSKTKAQRRTVTRGIIYDSGGDVYCYRNRRSRRVSVCGDHTQLHNPLVPNLLAVNKQIHAEGVGYLYKQQILLEDTTALHTFLAAIGATNRLQLSDITVKGWGNGRGAHKAMNLASLTLLSTCTNLKRFLLDCNIGWRRQPKEIARQLYRDGHYFLEAFGAANGNKDAALDVLEVSTWNNNRRNRYGWHGPADSVPDPEKEKDEFKAEMRKPLRC